MNDSYPVYRAEVGRPSIGRSTRFSRRRFSLRGVFVVLLLTAALFALGGWGVKRALLGLAEEGIAEVEAARISVQSGNFVEAETHLRASNRAFRFGVAWLSPFAIFPDWCLHIPGLSQAMTAQAIFGIGARGTGAALAALSVVENVVGLALPEAGIPSALAVFDAAKRDAAIAHGELAAAESLLSRIDQSVLPPEYREKSVRLEKALPLAVALLDSYVEHQSLFRELLGANGPRTYLFLFQNNHELRATGGFIGSYALLDVNSGRIRRFFVDGIFNPDGQLKENIVPPKPIQKISAGWSLHDSNWSPDFPAAAEKAMFFYEKSGGPTVDGIITLTPEVLERILTVVGPVTLSEYGVTVDAENFIPIIQEEVEVRYDKEENEPKRILGDLTEVLLRRFLSFDHPEETWQLGSALSGLLNERHILLYSRHSEIQNLIQAAGWSGKIIPASHDYLSVIHSNINGYKTDGVIDEIIQHEVTIHADGSVVDMVAITRTHRGGHTPYDWWNKVNADYLRVYVPEGSKLLSAEGMTREFPEPPLDYDALGFRRDPDIVREEEATRIDEVSGTRISTDAGKTVFGNWVYVSPGESVTVRYVYELPFRVLVGGGKDNPEVDSYSILYQKQSGTPGAALMARLSYPEALKPVWQTPENLIPYQRVFETNRTLASDFYWGVVFGKAHTAD